MEDLSKVATSPIIEELDELKILGFNIPFAFNLRLIINTRINVKQPISHQSLNVLFILIIVVNAIFIIKLKCQTYYKKKKVFRHPRRIEPLKNNIS
jgi:hypothetical protein